MVLQYAENGNLRNYLDKNYYKLRWITKFKSLYDIAYGLWRIHENKLIHRDLHIGNILYFSDYASITDLGLCKPANYIAAENSKNNVYGVLPYIAPEILQGQQYTEAADIYSFGIIIMYEVISGLPPYHNLSHDIILAIKICHGLRPRFNIKVPRLIVHLIKRCLDANPFDRPKAGEISYILDRCCVIKEEEEINNNLPISTIPSISLSYETKHIQKLFIQVDYLDLIIFLNQKNSDDYYDQMTI
jgi:serine/threonine protein kinase